jgi:DNA-binding FadR family transcriptional regulator
LIVTRDLHQAGKAHRDLLDVCRRGDPATAADAVWRHIMDAGEYLKELILRRRQHRSA